ncbi:MAG: hypothetical protein E7001_05330 [Coriobacteriaceae bacterium]|nr:hypothetical protein [Coriobacteriaceae bacterium]
MAFPEQGPDPVELKVTDSLRVALDHAFEDARACLVRDGGVMPFTVICTSDGFEVHDHPGDDVDETCNSVKTLLAQEVPEAYVFSYDGYLDLDEGRRDAIICEMARRGDAAAERLALRYERDEEGDLAFDDEIVSVGRAKALYPSGTKPIVSGLVQLAAEREAAERAAADSETRSAGLPDDTKE